MIAVIKVTDGTYNLIGTDNGLFVLQGNLTEAQLKDLLKKVRKALKK